MLGFTLSQSIQGSQSYVTRLQGRIAVAVAKLEKLGCSNGLSVQSTQTAKYYRTMFLPVLTANMTLPQLDRPDGSLPGYEIARQASATIIRRMLSTSALTSPALLAAEAGWDLPDKEIILAKLRLMDRLLRREHEHRGSDEDRLASGDRRDAPSVVLRQRIRDVQQGETKGFCAEVSRLWTEAGLDHKWPPLMDSPGTYKDNGRDMARAANSISRSRLLSAISVRSSSNPDQPYSDLWDGTTWRLNNGSRRQVGLMTTARLDALVMNDSKAMAGTGAPSHCPCCGIGYDNIQHALLSCKHPCLLSIRDHLETNLLRILSVGQQQELSQLNYHESKMFLLGKQLALALSTPQQIDLDLGVKKVLEDIDDFRTDTFHLNPMCGRTYTRPPEASLQQAALWDRMWREDQHLRDWFPQEDIPDPDAPVAHEADMWDHLTL